MVKIALLTKELKTISDVSGVLNELPIGKILEFQVGDFSEQRTFVKRHDVTEYTLQEGRELIHAVGTASQITKEIKGRLAADERGSNQLKKLEQIIEQERKVLYQFAKIYGTSDQRTLTKSVELDELLNMYFAGKRNKTG